MKKHLRLPGGNLTDTFLKSAMVVCPNCDWEFDWSAEAEVAPGCVECPDCGECVCQDGSVAVMKAGNPFHDTVGRFTTAASDADGLATQNQTRGTAGSATAKVDSFYHYGLLSSRGDSDLGKELYKIVDKLPIVANTDRVVAVGSEKKDANELEMKLTEKENNTLDRTNSYSAGYSHAKMRVQNTIDNGDFEHQVYRKMYQTALTRLTKIKSAEKAIYSAMAWENSNFHGLAALYRNHAAVLLNNQKKSRR